MSAHAITLYPGDTLAVTAAVVSGGTTPPPPVVTPPLPQAPNTLNAEFPALDGQTRRYFTSQMTGGWPADKVLTVQFRTPLAPDPYLYVSANEEGGDNGLPTVREMKLLEASGNVVWGPYTENSLVALSARTTATGSGRTLLQPNAVYRYVVRNLTPERAQHNVFFTLTK